MNHSMPDPSALISKAVPLCQPTLSQEHRIATVAQEAKALVDSYVTQLDDVVDVVFGGSFAKGTWLPDHADIDIFVRIKPFVGIEKFEELGREIGSKALKNYGPKLRYSDHPYVEVFVKKVRVNVVPCYDVEKKRHARLLKKFFKSVGIYGAEISTEGFSGYVSEVLVLKYSSFESVLRAAADWQERQIIAVCDYDSDFVKALNSPVIIIDPVDSRRNLGSAISPQSVAKFMLAARKFLEKPSLEFFKESKYHHHRRRRNGASRKLLLPNVLVVEFSHEKKSPDIIWGQLKRSINAIAKQLELAHFVVLRSSCITDETSSAALAFLLESITLPAYTKKKGPEVFRRKDSASFLSNRKSKPLAIW